MKLLKIAYITYEYPPDIGQGGIATYMGEIARAMSEMGHHVEVFSGSFNRNCSEVYNGILTHRVICSNPDEFREAVVAKFSERHQQDNFDVIECAEINADGAMIKEAYPNVPLVVKLHAPSYLLIRLLNSHTPFFKKLRFLIGHLKKGVWRPWGKPDLNKDRDYLFTLKADVIASPSLSLKQIIANDWKLKKDSIGLIPNPYQPSDQLLSIPIGQSNKNPTVLFVGKLNTQKGVLSLAHAIPAIKRSYPNARFTFVGNDGLMPDNKSSMRSYLMQKYNKYTDINFVGPVALDAIPTYLASADICVFPSMWENFPYVCLEAMSAGRAIIGSKNGGMAEMLANGRGILINPTNEKELEKALITLLQDKDLRNDLGASARASVLKDYNHQVIGVMMEKLYYKAINNRKAQFERLARV